MITDVNNEDRLVQATFAEHLRDHLGWESVYAHNGETFGSTGSLGRSSERDTVLHRDLRAALGRLNPELPESAREQAIEKLTRADRARSLLQHNREMYAFLRGGVPVEWRNASGETRHGHARVLDFRNADNNRFLAVRELKIQGLSPTKRTEPRPASSRATCGWRCRTRPSSVSRERRSSNTTS